MSSMPFSFSFLFLLSFPFLFYPFLFSSARLRSSKYRGSTDKPLIVARVKKIIHADEDISNCSNNAAFAITVATEQFLQYLVEQTNNVVKSERKQRRNIQYRDVGEPTSSPSISLICGLANVCLHILAGAVSRVDNLEFLTDVVPKTMTYKEYKAKKAKEATAAKTNGQSTLALNGASNGASTNGASTNGLNGVTRPTVASTAEAKIEMDDKNGDAMEIDRDETEEASES